MKTEDRLQKQQIPILSVYTPTIFNSSPVICFNQTTSSAKPQLVTSQTTWQQLKAIILLVCCACRMSSQIGFLGKNCVLENDHDHRGHHEHHDHVMLICKQKKSSLCYATLPMLQQLHLASSFSFNLQTPILDFITASHNSQTYALHQALQN